MYIAFSLLKPFHSPFSRETKLVRSLTTLLHQTSFLRSRDGFYSNFFCTAAMPRRGHTRPFEGSTTELYRRISPAGDPNVSIVPILDQWMAEGRSVHKQSLIDIMTKLLQYYRFSHALEISMWMTEKRGFELTSSDVSFRLFLISKAKGLDEAEQYFNSLSQNLKRLPVYGALLNCYATAQYVEKAEAVMQQIKNSGGKHTQNYNVMLNLYRKTGNMEKFNALLQEMEDNGIKSTNVTLSILLSAYADVKDIKRMDKVVRILECDPNLVSDWNIYCAAATGYTKVGLFDKAMEMLKRVEALATFNGYDAYNRLITMYGTIGRKDEVLRVWSLYKHKYKVYNKGYKSVLSMLVTLDDIEMAEEIFHEWESQGLAYDINIPNIMISYYCKKALVGKAEALLNKAISKGGKPNAWTWYRFIDGYLQNEQPEKAVEMMMKVIADSRPVPAVASIKACLKYLKRGGEEFVRLLVDRDLISLDQLEELSFDGNEQSK